LNLSCALCELKKVNFLCVSLSSFKQWGKYKYLACRNVGTCYRHNEWQLLCIYFDLCAKEILVHTLGIISKVLKLEQKSLERDKNKFEVSQVNQILLGFTASLPAPKGLSTK